MFEQACDLPPAEARALLARRCPDDSAARDAALRLVEAHGRKGDFLGKPAVQPAPSAALAPRRVGAYNILREIGSGGMGVVYLALRVDDVFQRAAALKILRPIYRQGPLAERFVKERRILARLDHPNIARILDGGTTPEGLPYVLMDYVEGEPIYSFCEARQSSLQQRINLVKQACVAVQYLHENHVLHRDLKPANMLVTSQGAVKLLDFGIAKLLDETLGRSASGTLIMTPAYASPEQRLGRNCGPESDLYSLGVILYELLTGKLPAAPEADPRGAGTRFRPAGVEPAQAIAAPSRVGGLAPGVPAIPRDLDYVVLKALAREPEKRYGSAAALAQELERVQAGHAVEARRGSPCYRITKFFQLHGWKVAAALLLAASLSWAGVASYYVRQQKAQLQHAQERLNAMRTTLPRHRVPALHNTSAPAATAAVAAVKDDLEAYQADAENVLKPMLGRPFAPREMATEYVHAGLDYLLQAAPLAAGAPDLATELAHSFLDTARLEWSADSPSLSDVRAAKESCDQALAALDAARSAPGQDAASLEQLDLLRAATLQYRTTLPQH